MDISDPDNILTELQLQQSEEDEDGQVYYTILQQDVENFTLKTDDQEYLDTDNVFYLPLENEEVEEIEARETEMEPIAESSINMELLEQITLPDGTQAYVANEGEITEDNPDTFELSNDSEMIIPEMVQNMKREINFSSEDEDDVDEIPQEIEDNSAVLMAQDTEELDETRYQQVQLIDGSVAIIEIGLYNSIVEQSKKKVQPSREVTKHFICPDENCGKSYTTMHHLRVHMRNHTGSRPYKCSVENCDKSFSTAYSLKAHSRTHTGEKPYGCQVCFKCFKTSGDLQKHVRIHTGEKPFVCPIEGCGRSFTTSNIRKVHIRSHTGERPYQCKEPGCLKAFASATNYKNHVRIHSGEKPYVCPVETCGKRFTEYSSLYKHQVVHANTRVCKCEYCGRVCRQPSTLAAHKRTSHNIIITENGTEIMLKMIDKTPQEYLEEENTTTTSDTHETQILFVSQ